LVLDQDHPFLSVGIDNYYKNNNEGNDDAGGQQYWAGLTWDLSYFLPTDDENSGFSYKEVRMTVYEIQYGNNNNNWTTRCDNATIDAVTFVRVVPPLDNNFTMADNDDFLPPTVSCQSYHWLERKIEKEKRTTTIVAAVLGSGLAMAILALIALGRVIVRLKQQQHSQKASAA
jgi:hypothetical protein